MITSYVSHFTLNGNNGAESKRKYDKCMFDNTQKTSYLCSYYNIIYITYYNIYYI